MRAPPLALGYLLLASCIGAPPMTAARVDDPGPPTADRARVVFFMPSYEADAPPFARYPAAARDSAMAGTVVVDDRGRLLGAVRPGAFIVADVEPGDREFFAEDARQLDTECVTDCLAFGAMRARLAAGRIYGVLVEHPNRFAIGGDDERHRLDLVRAGGAPVGRPGWTWLRLDPDAADWSRDHADTLRAIVRSGRERMTRADEWDARDSVIGGGGPTR